MMTTKECNCALLGTPSWHARDNVHHVTNVWHCPVHGKQSKTTLIHKEKQAGCVPCNKEPEAGWDSTMEINTLATKLQSDNYSRSEIARRLLALVEKAYQRGLVEQTIKLGADYVQALKDAKVGDPLHDVLEKVREEAKDEYMLADTLELETEARKQGRTAALSRVEREIDDQFKAINSFSGKGFVTEDMKSFARIALKDIKAIITKIREEV